MTNSQLRGYKIQSELWDKASFQNIFYIKVIFELELLEIHNYDKQ